MPSLQIFASFMSLESKSQSTKMNNFKRQIPKKNCFVFSLCKRSTDPFTLQVSWHLFATTEKRTHKTQVSVQRKITMQQKFHHIFPRDKKDNLSVLSPSCGHPDDDRDLNAELDARYWGQARSSSGLKRPRIWSNRSRFANTRVSEVSFGNLVFWNLRRRLNFISGQLFVVSLPTTTNLTSTLTPSQPSTTSTTWPPRSFTLASSETCFAVFSNSSFVLQQRRQRRQRNVSFFAFVSHSFDRRSSAVATLIWILQKNKRKFNWTPFECH